MPKRTAIAVSAGPPDRSVIRIGGLASLASLSSLFYYAQRGEILMHGDATAHINIARRVFDSLTPGPLQLGTVWLPLPHLLMMPFIYSDKLWQSGVGGSIPSMCAYVLGVLGIVRLVGGLLESDARMRPMAHIGAWIAAFAYGANPNLIYMQATALTEALYLGFFIWALVYFAEFLRALGEAPRETRSGKEREDEATRQMWTRPLRRCAYCLAAAEMTRYDGWFLAGVLGVILIAIAVRQREDRILRVSTLKFLAGIAVMPALWLIYNAAVYGNALDFANGPYSAKAIELRVGAPNPAFHNFWVGGLYFLKSAQITLAVGNWGRWWLAGAILAACAAFYILRGRAAAILVLLWAPLPFYAYSISYGWVPLHVPMWWPYAVFNQRFGLELLPMFAVSAGFLVAGVTVWLRGEQPSAAMWSLVAAVVALVVVSYAFVLKDQPLCLVEAERSWNMRRGLDSSIERLIKPLPPDTRFMMDLGEHVGIMERLGIPLRQVVNTENHRPWKRPSDPEGIWERALADPGKYVDYVIAFEGDPVDRGVNRANLTLWTVIHSTGQPAARIYETRRAMNQSR
ncbi:MAG: hypothetical protein WA609_12470 [Terriglobales bacterium]